MVEVDEMLDAQAIDVCIVSNALRGKVLAEIGTIGANQLGNLGNGDVVLQIELRLLAKLLQQWSDVLCRHSGNGRAVRHGGRKVEGEDSGRLMFPLATGGSRRVQ